MLLSKKQQCILEMIKGPDIYPAGSSPGHYSSKNFIEITAEGKRYRIAPTEVLDLSDPECLVVLARNSKYNISWESIHHIGYKEPPEQTTPILQPEYSRSQPRIFQSPLGKKIG